MIDRLVHALIASPNAAADDVLLESLDLGNPVEKRVALGALLRRARPRGLAGVVDRFDALPPNLKSAVLDRIADFVPALADCARSLDLARRLAALHLIALGRLARLGYVLLENLGDGDDRARSAATQAIVALARHVAAETRALQRGAPRTPAQIDALLTLRPQVEDLVTRALDRQRPGTSGADLTRAALLLADSPQSLTLAVLRQSRHPARPAMERRLGQPPASEHVDAFLLAASHAGLRAPFAGTFAHIHERPVLDALLRRSHWLKDHRLAICTGNIMGGRWMDDLPLARDLANRPPADAAPIADWVGASGCAPVVKDVLLARLLEKSADDPAARLRVLRHVLTRPRTASVELLKDFLKDPDERLRRIATRELARRRPPGHQLLLTSAAADATPSIRQIIGRAVGDAAFRTYLARYDRLDPAARRPAGRAVTRILPDPARRLSALISSGGGQDRIKLLQIARETDLVGPLRSVVLRLVNTDPDPRVRSKAVSTTAALIPVPSPILIDRVLMDTDARVRANAIEVLELTGDFSLTPILANRLSAENNRERANAIKALAPLAPDLAAHHLDQMLSDPRPPHRVSALWATRSLRRWSALPHVGRLARLDPDPAVRRYALSVLKSAATSLSTPGMRGGSASARLSSPDSSSPPRQVPQGSAA